MATLGQRPYWLRGEEECPHCLMGYTFAVERRCAQCDEPACQHCVTILHATGEAVCVRCARASSTATAAEKED